MVNLAKWLIKMIKKEKLKNITYRAARFAPAKNEKGMKNLNFINIKK